MRTFSLSLVPLTTTWKRQQRIKPKQQ